MVDKAKSRPSRRRWIVKLHRWLGLGAAAFWIVQAVTGMLIMFHWELRDVTIAGAHRPTDLGAIERRLDMLAPPGTRAAIGSVWTTAGAPDRYDVHLTDAQGVDHAIRIAGDGTVLRGMADGESDVLDLLVGVHHELLAGETGSWIVAISGLLLISNLIAGLALAWPRRAGWRFALKPQAKGPTTARIHGWHRALGLWLVVPALIIVATGTMLKFEDGLGALIGAEQPGLPAIPPRGHPVGFATAARAALDAIPGSSLTAVSFPDAGDATYHIRVLAPGEIRRAYGASVVLIDANDGSVRRVLPIEEAEGPRAFMSALFPVHTAEAGGLPGRIFAMLIGGWLVTMVVLGIVLWLRRRPQRGTS